MAKARRLHRSHAVGGVEIHSGSASASVSDSDGEVFEVTVSVVAPPRAKAVPAADDILTTCGCDDDGDVCRHALAALLSVAEEVEADARTIDLWTGAEAPESPAATTYESPKGDAEGFFIGKWWENPRPIEVAPLRSERVPTLVVDGIDAGPVIRDAQRSIADELGTRS